MANLLIGLQEEDQQKIFRQIPSMRDAIFLGLFVQFEFNETALYDYLGVSQPELSHWRLGRRDLPEAAALRAAAILPVPVEMINAPMTGPAFVRRAPKKEKKSNG